MGSGNILSFDSVPNNPPASIKNMTIYHQIIAIFIFRQEAPNQRKVYV